MTRAYSEGTYDASDGRPETPIDPSRSAIDLFWGDIVIEGDGDDPDDDEIPRHLQLPFMWDPRVNDWGSVATFVYHFGMDQAAVPSGLQDSFRRPGMQGDTTDTCIVPGDGYIVGIQTGYKQGTLNSDYVLQVHRETFASGVTDTIFERAYPSRAAKVPHAHKFFRPDPPLPFMRRDTWQFQLVNTQASGTNCNYPWIDVYWHFRLVDPLVGRNVSGVPIP